MHCLHSWNVCSFVTRQFQTSFQALGSKAWRLKIHHKRTGGFSSLFLEKNFKRTNHFGIFAFGVVRKLLLSLIRHNFLFYVEKCSDNADADVSKVWHSVSPIPVRCPVKRGKEYAMIVVVFFASKWTHVGLNLCILSEIYESETRDAQVDGSLLGIYRQFYQNQMITCINLFMELNLQCVFYFCKCQIWLQLRRQL